MAPGPSAQPQREIDTHDAVFILIALSDTDDYFEVSLVVSD